NLNGWGNFNISGQFTWGGGTLLSYYPPAADTGWGRNQQFTVNVAVGAELTMEYAGTRKDEDFNFGYNCRLVNNGMIWWRGIEGFNYTGLARVDNYGNFIAQGSGTLFGGMLRVFNNHGFCQYDPKQYHS